MALAVRVRAMAQSQEQKQRPIQGKQPTLPVPIHMKVRSTDLTSLIMQEEVNVLKYLYPTAIGATSQLPPRSHAQGTA